MTLPNKLRAWIPKEKCFIAHREVIERAHLQFNDSLDVDVVNVLRYIKEDGTELYDGDIVYIAGYGLEVVGPFCELQMRIMTGDSSDIEDLKGNIYENPELVEL